MVYMLDVCIRDFHRVTEPGSKRLNYCVVTWNDFLSLLSLTAYCLRLRLLFQFPLSTAQRAYHIHIYI